MVIGLDVAVPVAASALFAVGGLVALWSGLRQYRHQRGAVRRASQTSGMIEAVGIEEVLNGAQRSYVPSVEYEYQTPTQRRRGRAVYPGGDQYTKLFGTESAAETAIEGYEAGDSTMVYYDPNEPDHSFLEPTPHRGPNVADIIVGLGLIGLGCFLLVATGVV